MQVVAPRLVQQLLHWEVRQVTALQEQVEGQHQEVQVIPSSLEETEVPLEAEPMAAVAAAVLQQVSQTEEMEALLLVV